MYLTRIRQKNINNRKFYLLFQYNFLFTHFPIDNEMRYNNFLTFYIILLLPCLFITHSLFFARRKTFSQSELYNKSLSLLCFVAAAILFDIITYTYDKAIKHGRKLWDQVLCDIFIIIMLSYCIRRRRRQRDI